MYLLPSIQVADYELHMGVGPVLCSLLHKISSAQQCACTTCPHHVMRYNLALRGGISGSGSKHTAHAPLWTLGARCSDNQYTVRNWVLIQMCRCVGVWPFQVDKSWPVVCTCMIYEDGWLFLFNKNCNPNVSSIHWKLRGCSWIYECVVL